MLHVTHLRRVEPHSPLALSSPWHTCTSQQPLLERSWSCARKHTAAPSGSAPMHVQTCRMICSGGTASSSPLQEPATATTTTAQVLLDCHGPQRGRRGTDAELVPETSIAPVASSRSQKSALSGAYRSRGQAADLSPLPTRGFHPDAAVLCVHTPSCTFCDAPWLGRCCVASMMRSGTASL